MHRNQSYLHFDANFDAIFSSFSKWISTITDKP